MAVAFDPEKVEKARDELLAFIENSPEFQDLNKDEVCFVLKGASEAVAKIFIIPTLREAIQNIAGTQENDKTEEAQPAQKYKQKWNCERGCAIRVPIDGN